MKGQWPHGTQYLGPGKPDFPGFLEAGNLNIHVKSAGFLTLLMIISF
jgi:hypothetical protein